MATKSITGINGPMDLYVIRTVDGRTEHIFAGSIEQAREVARRASRAGHIGPVTSVKKG